MVRESCFPKHKISLLWMAGYQYPMDVVIGFGNSYSLDNDTCS